MKEMLVGLETEYGVYCDIARLKNLLGVGENYLYVILRQIPKVLPRSDYFVAYKESGEFWTRAGMRLYPDSAKQIEAATGECATFEEMVFQKNAGDRLVQALVENARAELRKEPYRYGGPFAVYANNTAADFDRPPQERAESEASFARHENYLLRRDRLGAAAGAGKNCFDLILENLGCLFAALPVLGGAGHITPAGQFVLSPRAACLMMPMQGGTTTSRPLVNSRDEPHADGRKFIRYHHTASDTNITDNITEMKVAFTYWALRLLERGWKAPDWLKIGSPKFSVLGVIGLAESINTDPFLSAAHAVGGRRLKAVDILMEYLCAVDRHRSALLFEREDDEIFQGVASYLERARSGFEALVGESEWATKYDLMLREMRKKNIKNFNDARLKKLSLVLHNLDRNPRENPFVQFRDKVLPPNMEIKDLNKACRKAPKTRAYCRGLGVFLANKFGVNIVFPNSTEWTGFFTPLDPNSIQQAFFSLNGTTPWRVAKEDILAVVRRMKSAAAIQAGIRQGLEAAPG